MIVNNLIVKQLFIISHEAPWNFLASVMAGCARGHADGWSLIPFSAARGAHGNPLSVDFGAKAVLCLHIAGFMD